MSAARYRRAAATLDIVDLDPLDNVDQLLGDPTAVRRAAARPIPTPPPTPTIRSQPTSEYGPPRRRTFGTVLSLS